MDSIPPSTAPDDQLDPPPRIFERLRQIAGYTWDDSKAPIHTSFDSWLVWGTRFVSPYTSSPPHHASSPGSASRFHSGRPSPSESFVPSAFHSDASSDPPTTTPPASNSSVPEISYVEEPVVARVSYRVVREERAFHVTKDLAVADPEWKHIIKPLDLLRLTPQQGDRSSIVLAIYQDPGANHLPNVIDLGPAYYKSRKVGDAYQAYIKPEFHLDPPLNLTDFLNFAIGATQCLEILHHGNNSMVHGEIRGDAFHYNIDTGKVRLVSFGSGVRSFEHGLTSTGWSTLSREVGAKNKLQFISPEQTGRMPAEPDSRTDIYSLGVLFWILLVQKPAFEGETPLDIVQNLLRRRIPSVSIIKPEVPDVIGRIIQKCTSKSLAERYHSASGLRYDLTKVQQLIRDCDWTALRELTIGSKDVSSFFMLPTTMIGREGERAQLLRVIQRVASTHATKSRPVGGTNRFSDASSFSNEFLDTNDISSEGASSTEGNNRHSGSYAQTVCSDPRQSRGNYNPSIPADAQTIHSIDSVPSPSSGPINRVPRPWERQHSVSFETRSLMEGSMAERDVTRNSTVESSSSSTLSRQLGTAKFRQRGHCEIIVVEGVAGQGKSFLVQSVLADARRQGYCVTAKFDAARRTPFGPLLKLLSSLFKQVWGERNTETPFHQALKHYVRPVWPMLHKLLGLPEFLLGPIESTATRSASTSSRPTIKRRGSSPGMSRASATVGCQSSQDFLRAGAATKSSRLMNTFMDVLRMFTAYNFICFCLDDLHYADDESLELITQIIAAKMKMVMIVTYRSDDSAVGKVNRVLHPSESDHTLRSGTPIISRIALRPLCENDIEEYVAMALSRPNKDDVKQLAYFIHQKTAGNPFYMREMLNVCYRKDCIRYDYKNTQWQVDIEKLFHVFQNEKSHDVMGTEFLTKRLDELPNTTRAILAWAALFGQSFSFELISRLLSGEFTSGLSECHGCLALKTYPEQDAIEGLQAAIQAHILVPSDSDDRFRFVHDRYVQAAIGLKECNAREMHFVIAQTLLKYYSFEARSRDGTASHICEAVDLIRRRIGFRRPFRDLLFECAQVATENGARPTAAKYYSNAVALLQPNPWVDGAEDVSYDETLQLYLRAAECALFMGHHAAANGLLSTVFKSARSALDKAPAYVLQSRIFAQSGDAESTLKSLKECLLALGVKLDDGLSFEQCDEKFLRLSAMVRSRDRVELIDAQETTDPTLSSVGAVFAETLSAAWWIDTLQFYNLALTMLDLHLTAGGFPQSGMAYIHFAIITLSRFNDVQFAVDLGSIGLELLDKYHDPVTISRGYLMFANFLAHISYSMRFTFSHVEGLVAYAAVAGDRIATILSVGTSALVKLFASDNCMDLEAFCQYGCEEIPNWQQDSRGGTLLLGVRQMCRALQGKTNTKEPDNILSDGIHDMAAYKGWLRDHTCNGGRSLLLYETFETLTLFLYGHYDQAIEVGGRCLQNISKLWSLRNSRSTMLAYGLALAGRAFRKTSDPAHAETDELKAEIADAIAQLKSLLQNVVDWQVVNGVNYLSWSKYLEAQIEELSGHVGLAVQLYEEGLEHAAVNGFTGEEALGSYLLGGLFIRQKATRSARAALKDAVSLYRQFGACGVAEFIQEEHAGVLHSPSDSARITDAAVQTDFAADTAHTAYRHADAEETDQLPQGTSEAEAKENRIGAWRGSMHMEHEAGAGLPALDMIDLHAILVSSQAMSSVLQIDELLKTMCDAILQTCGGSANSASIVVQDNDYNSWCLAASGDQERGASAHIPGLPLAGTSLVAENVVLYCTRFREPVFIADLLADERFGNVSEAWLQKNTASKAVIAIPITHGEKPLLGVLYLEGEPGSFTDRNVTVLQLLVNQIGISYSNALAMKAVEKVSAEYVSALSLQKDALAKALEAETKAKNAEAEAKRNVKLAEEAARAKSIFLANVSHELRTPLNGVIGNSELLRESNLNKEQLEMADSIRVSADLLLTVINDILDFSRMEADKMKLYVSAFNPEEMVREVVRAASYSNREKTKRVRIIQDINLPPMLIYGDPIRLHQVLGNLIGNSIKFTEQGSVTIGARVESEGESAVTLTFWVEDTGIGIPPKQLANLFQPFSQADASTARKYGGSGLGLSICKNLIETMMKGEIKLQSEENVGTRAWFTVTFDKALAGVSAGDSEFPAATAAADNSPSAENPPSPPDAFVDLSLLSKEDLRICIAEDNAINQKIAIQYVRRLGYTNVDAYENGERAVEGLRRAAAEGRPYHVILMDVQMPVLDGYEATKVIRRDESEAVRKVLVIAMTASAIHGDREKCIAAGMNDYLAKPVRSDILKRKLEAYVGHSVVDEPGAVSANAGSNPPPPGDNSPLAEAPSGADPRSGPNGTTAGPPANMEPCEPSTSTPAPIPPSTGASTSTSIPIPDKPSIESRASSRGRSSSDRRASDAGDGSTKRQPRKLVKNRSSVDMSGQPPVPAIPAHQQQGPPPAATQPQALPLQQVQNAEKPERSKGVLTKKPPSS